MFSKSLIFEWLPSLGASIDTRSLFPYCRLIFVLVFEMQMDERRTKRRYDQARSSSGAPPQVQTRHPWRKEDDEIIKTVQHFMDPRRAVFEAACTHRHVTDQWDDYDRIYYNAWKGVDIEPTCFTDRATIKRLGIYSDVKDMFKELGLGTMATRSYPLYPILFAISCLRCRYLDQQEGQEGKWGDSDLLHQSHQVLDFDSGSLQHQQVSKPRVLSLLRPMISKESCFLFTSRYWRFQL